VSHLSDNCSFACRLMCRDCIYVTLETELPNTVARSTRPKCMFISALECVKLQQSASGISFTSFARNAKYPPRPTCGGRFQSIFNPTKSPKSFDTFDAPRWRTTMTFAIEHTFRSPAKHDWSVEIGKRYRVLQQYLALALRLASLPPFVGQLAERHREARAD